MAYTETAWGCIEHLRITTAAGTVEAPVKLRPAAGEERVRNGLAVGFDGLPYPECRGERLVYVLPGGGEIVGMRKPPRCSAGVRSGCGMHAEAVE